MLESVRSFVLDVQDLSWCAPNLTVTFRTTDEILLVVDGSENVVSTNTGSQDRQSVKVGKGYGVSGQILCLKGIHCR